MTSERIRAESAKMQKENEKGEREAKVIMALSLLRNPRLILAGGGMS